MPPMNKLKKQAAKKALLMHEVLRARKKGSGSADNAAMLEDSIQVITPSEELTNQSHILLEHQGEDSAHDQDSVKDLTVEFPAQESTSFSIAGRRIISIYYFYSRLQEISGHGNLSCGLQCVEIVAERQVGLHSKFTLKCKMCNAIFYIENDPRGEVNINDCAVVGSVAIGCGHSQLQELSAALNLPIMTPKTYRACHCSISTYWEKNSVESMNAAAQKERDMAIAEGRVDENGIAIIDVIVDGCWSKRTYKKNYSALSGAAAIIGKRTGEVLFLGVKNKYCSICAQAAKADKEAKEHVCYKNYSGPSTAMESTILVEGFKCSIEMHNLIYGRMVSDGDSSTHAQLLKTRPYSNVSVEKIECRNHLLRNLCNKLTALQTDTKLILRHRKLITQKRIMILRQTIRKIIKIYKADSESERRCNIDLLYNDLLLAHLHAFDDHSRCKPSFCNNSGEGESQPTEFYTSTLWSRICVLMSNVASHAPSLIHDIDSNSVERYNSIVAKLVGGKRINFSKRGSYQTRCHAAVISFNTHKLISSTFKTMAGRSPRGSIKKLESRRIKQVMRIRKIIRKKNRKLYAKGEDINYGDKCDKPDMASHIFERQKNTFLQNLVKTKEVKQKIERDTIHQSSCSEWLELRRKLLTASNFGKVIKRRNDISCHNIVKDIIYNEPLTHIKSVKHGKDNEQKALKQLEVQENLKILPCGLYIDDECDFLGATPDGIIDDETIVEIKCPISAYEKDIQVVVENKKLPFYKLNDKKELEINKSHNWYYQMQGQLNITKKSKCLFAIWTGEKNNIKTEVVHKDEGLWKQIMKPKLINFYLECMLPELVDPRIPRNMKIRDPIYIQDAKLNKAEKAKSKKNLKRKHTENAQKIYKKNILKNNKYIEKENVEKIEKRKDTDAEHNKFPMKNESKKQKTRAVDNILCNNTHMCDNISHDENVPVLTEQASNTDYFECNSIRELNFAEF